MSDSRTDPYLKPPYDKLSHVCCLYFVSQLKGRRRTRNLTCDVTLSPELSLPRSLTLSTSLGPSVCLRRYCSRCHCDKQSSVYDSCFRPLFTLLSVTLDTGLTLHTCVLDPLLRTFLVFTLRCSYHELYSYR